MGILTATAAKAKIFWGYFGIRKNGNTYVKNNNNNNNKLI